MFKIKKIVTVMVLVVFALNCSGIHIYGGQTGNLITEGDLWHSVGGVNYSAIKDSQGYLRGNALHYMGTDTSLWHKEAGYMAHGIPTVGEETQAWCKYNIPRDSSYLKALNKGDLNVLAGIELKNRSAIQRDSGQLELRFHSNSTPFSGYIASSISAASSPTIWKWDPVTINTSLPRGTKTIYYRLNADNSSKPALWGDFIHPENNLGCWVMFSNPYLILRDTIKPKIKSITLNGGIYVTGETLGVCVEFDENVEVIGPAPTLTLDLPGNPVVALNRIEDSCRFWFNLETTQEMYIDNANLRIVSINNLASIRDVLGKNSVAPFYGQTLSGVSINNAIPPSIVEAIKKDIYRADIDLTGEIELLKRDFEDVFADRNGDNFAGLIVPTLPDPSVGVLKYNGIAITAGQVISFNGPEKLTFTPKRADEMAYLSNVLKFQYKMIDSSGDALESNLGTVEINLMETLSVDDFNLVVDKVTNTNVINSSFINNTSYKNGGLAKLFIRGFIFKTLPDPAIGKFIDKNGNDIPLEYKWCPSYVVVAPGYAIGDLIFVPTGRVQEGTSFEIQAIHAWDRESNIATVTVTADLANSKPTIWNLKKLCEVGSSILFSEEDFVLNYADIESEDNSNMEKIKIVSLPVEGTLILNENPVILNQEIEKQQLNQLKFTPVDNSIRNISFSWQASDSELYSDSANVNIVINHSPVVQEFQISVDEDTKLQFKGSNFSDYFEGKDVGDTLERIKLIRLPENGLLKLDNVVIVENQEISFAKISKIAFKGEDNYNGVINFSWQGYDGYSYSNTAQVNMVINPVNDLPKLSEIIKNTEENKTLEFSQIDFEDAYTDIENNPLRKIRVVTLPENQMGVLWLNGVEIQLLDEINVDQLAGLTFEPKQDIVCKTNFAYQAFDGINWQGIERGNVVLNVLSQNDSVEKAKENLGIAYASGDSAVRVINNVHLASEGLYGTLITWESSDAGTVSEIGVVRRPNYAKDHVTVVLTATITKDHVEAKKTFEITVIKGEKSVSYNRKDESKETKIDGAKYYKDLDKYYKDLDKYEEAIEAISHLTEKNIIEGRELGKYEPEEKITRGEFVAYIVNLMGIYDEHATEPFEDVDASTAYAQHIASAYAAGLIKGYSNKRFGPSDLTKYEDMTVVMVRALQLREEVELGDFELLPFLDKQSISDYAREKMVIAYNYELLEGNDMENGRKARPTNKMSRAKAATMIYRLYRRFNIE